MLIDGEYCAKCSHYFPYALDISDKIFSFMSHEEWRESVSFLTPSYFDVPVEELPTYIGMRRSVSQ